MDTKPLEELIIDPNNPKTLSDFDGNNLAASLKKYGSLDGIVFNRKLARLVGGNSRVQLLHTKLIGNNRIVYVTKYDTPDEQGTVALGYVYHNNMPIPYREVEFSEVVHREASIAATAIQGDFVDQLLAENNQFIMENNGDILATGQKEEDIEKLLASFGGPMELEQEPEPKQSKHDDGMKRITAKFTDEQMLEVDEVVMLAKHDKQFTGEVNPDLTANAIQYICRFYKENRMSQNVDPIPQTTTETPDNTPLATETISAVAPGPTYQIDLTSIPG